MTACDGENQWEEHSFHDDIIREKNYKAMMIKLILELDF